MTFCPGCVVKVCLHRVRHPTFHNVTEKQMTRFLWLGQKGNLGVCVNHTCLKNICWLTLSKSPFLKGMRSLPLGLLKFGAVLLRTFQQSLHEWLSGPRVPVLNLVPWNANLLIRPSLFVQRKLLILSLSSWPRAIQGVRSHRVTNSWTWKTFQCISPSDHSRLCGIRNSETNDSTLIVGRGWTWVIFTF